MDFKRVRFVAPVVGASLLLAPLASSLVQAQGNPGICFGITTSAALAQGLNVIDVSQAGQNTQAGTGARGIDAIGTADLARSDFFIGSAGDDTFDAQAGDDIGCGKFGNDQLFGGDQADRLKGGPGNDLIFGDQTAAGFVGAGGGAFFGQGATGTAGTAGVGVPGTFGTGTAGIIQGPAGGEVLDPTLTVGTAGGNDVIQGGAGADQLAGNQGDDVLRGRLGNDLIRGGPGRDTIDCGPDIDAADIDPTDPVRINCETNLNTVG